MKLLSWRIYAQSAGTRLLGSAFVLISSVLIAKTLGASGRGEFAVVITAIALTVQLANVGISSALTFELAARNSRRRKEIFGASLAASGVVLPLCALILGGLLLAGYTISPIMRVLLVTWPIVQLLNLYVQSIFLGLGRYHWFNGLELAARSGSLAVIAALIAAKLATFQAILVGTFSVEFVLALVGLGALTASIGAPSLPRKDLFTEMAKVGLRAYALLLLPFILVRTDVLLLKLWASNAEIGIYAVSAQIVALLLILPQSFGQILFSTLRADDQRVSQTVRVYQHTLWLLVAGAAIAAITAPFIIPLLFGDEFRAAVHLLWILLPGAVALGTQTVLVQYYNSMGFPAVIMKYWAIGVVVNILGNCLLMPKYGAVGAAIMSTVSYAAVSLLVLRKFLNSTAVPAVSLLNPSSSMSVAK